LSCRFPILCTAQVLLAIGVASAQGLGLVAPPQITAGHAFSIRCSGQGNATLYIVGPGKVLKRSIALGTTAVFPVESIDTAGDYLVILTGASSTRSAWLKVLPQVTPAALSFLAEPTRLPVDMDHGIAGTVYVFDAYRNLIDTPTPVSFQLESPSGAVQATSTMTRGGAAWTQMNSTRIEGDDKFVARSGSVSVTREIRQTAGEPCQLTMTASQSGGQLELVTAPVRDCSGNLVADGTIVTFTETHDGTQSTADVPVKHGIAKIEMPADSGAVLSVASGVVLGSQFSWEK